MNLLRITTVASLFLAALSAHALEVKPYSAAVLQSLQTAGKPVAVHFHADWCPLCRTQDKALNNLKAESNLDLTVLQANYDTERELKRQLSVRSQATLVAFKGRQEAGRLVGETGIDSIRSVLKAAL